MFSKVFVILALTAAANSGVVPVAPAAGPVLAKIEDFDAVPQYSFAYDVQDSLTGDSKAQYETRNGDIVQGSYSLIEPDGVRRVVDYTSDPVNGFNAVVSREPSVVARASPVISPAPVVARAAPFVATPPVAAPVVARASPFVAPAPVAAPVVARASPFVAAGPVAAPVVARASPFVAAGPVAAPVVARASAPGLAYSAPLGYPAVAGVGPLAYSAALGFPPVAKVGSPVGVSAPLAYSAPTVARLAAPLTYAAAGYAI